MKLGAVVLAAGAGTRMRSALPKMLHPLCGRPLVGHALAVADAIDAETVVVLSAEILAPVRAALGERYRYVVQAERLGTGHAVLQAREALRGRTDEVLVLLGDVPLLTPGTARRLLELRRASGALMGVLSFEAHPPTGYGRVVRDAGGAFVALVEERDATPEQRAIAEVNSGLMCFDAAWLWEAIGRLRRNPLKGEYYLTDLAALAVAEGGAGAAVALQAEDPAEALGVNDRAQLAEAAAVLRRRTLAELMRAGVTVVDPAATYVDVGVAVGPDSTLHPGTILRGATSVGGGCEIGPHATILDSRIGDRARVRHAVIERATLLDDAVVGPFVHIGGDA
jgi:bifunctional UDP-N-acetylglucosamine pyrophosphorylase / glucosamine-1-phosphate N-acetyltransferase